MRLIIDRTFQESQVTVYVCESGTCIECDTFLLSCLRSNKQQFVRKILRDNLFLISKELSVLLIGSPANAKWFIPYVQKLVPSVHVFVTKENSRRRYVIFTLYPSVLQGFQNLYSSSNESAKRIRLWRFRNILEMALDGSLSFSQLSPMYFAALSLFVGVSPKFNGYGRRGNRRFKLFKYSREEIRQKLIQLKEKLKEEGFQWIS